MYQHLVYGKSPFRQHQRQTQSGPALNSDLIIKSCRLLSAGESEIYEKSYA
jgi:hypothetical protein